MESSIDRESKMALLKMSGIIHFHITVNYYS